VDDDTILSIAVTPDGALWFGKEHGGLSRFDGQEWTTYTFAASPTGQVVLVGNSIFSIAVAPDGALWLGTGMGGVYRFAGPVDRIGDMQAWTIYTMDDGLVSSRINAIAVAPDGTLWFGSADSTPRNGGVSHFTGPARGAGNGETWITYTENDGLASDIVHAIAVAPDGTLWFGTGNVLLGYGGASHFSVPAAGAGADGAWTTYTAEEGLGSNVVLSIAIAPNNALWFGTHGGGVSRFGGEPAQLSVDDEAWLTYTTKDGLGSNFVWCIAVAPDGTLWLGTSNGLSRYSPSS
jgi:ligand-binding sensor domain-containing protein